MKIKRWVLLTALFAVLGGTIVASGCQTTNTASTANAGGASSDTDCMLCYNCTVAGQTYNCNDPDGRSEYIDACMANCEFNGKVYDCTTPLGCMGFWSAITCNMCMQVCEGADDSGNN